ncbi:MAG: radical SAM protein [Desulfovibrionaceae bacterium]|nr:radical SAM protein [Desulfovibrionaceae bacterium]
MRGSGVLERVRGIDRVLVDESVRDSALARRVGQRLAGLGLDPSWEVVPDGSLEPAPGQGQLLRLKRFRGRFLRFCPGTRNYRCCGYRIIHIGENCPLSCSYCILKAYFQDQALRVWANQEDLFAELDRAFGAQKARRFRVGTGEFTDSLALEALTGYSQDLVGFLGAHPNVCLELKTKVADLSFMDAVPRPDRVLPAWSLNSPDIWASEEPGSASLEERLDAARTCARAGFRVCLHFDPIILYPGWEQGYARTVDMIFDYLRPEDVAYLSLGSFRFMPRLKAAMLCNSPDATYVYGEFAPGLDGKMRLLRPLRARQLKFVADRLRSRGLDRQIYLCMESDEVWRAVLGRTPPSPGGLAGLLMDLAFGGSGA